VWSYQDSTWGLKPSIERKFKEFGLVTNDYRNIELGLLRRFKRQCYHYMLDVPKENDELEWLTLMQHHFAPTRLLDWTYSVFVALYFAVEKSKKIEGKETYHCAVWAFDSEWMVEPFKDNLKEKNSKALKYWEDDHSILKPQTFRELFFRDKNAIPLVGVVTPQRLNQRINIQQGTFLCQGDISKKFEENFIAILSKKKDESKNNFIKLVLNIDLKNKKDIFLHLQRMNINRATLFPGLARIFHKNGQTSCKSLIEWKV
jgi:FRG domain